MPNTQDTKEQLSATATGTSAGASATIAGVTGQLFAVSHVSGVSDTAANLQILGGSNGTTVIWQLKLQANVAFAVSFPEGAQVLGTKNQAVAGKIDASTSACSVNISAIRISTA